MQTILTLDHLPPSVNHIWKHPRRGKTYRSEAYMTWLNGEGWNVKAQLKGQPTFTGPVWVTAALRRPRANADLDNRLKGLGDLLQATGVIDNDKNITRWDVYWSFDMPDRKAAQITIVRWV